MRAAITRPARFAGIVEIQLCATKGNDSGGVAGTALTVEMGTHRLDCRLFSRHNITRRVLI